MDKVLIALQGTLNEKTLNCAKTFLKLKYDVLMISWRINQFSKYDFGEIKVDFINDPGTVNYGLYGVNALRQIVSNRYILDNYGVFYDYIIRLRNDIELTNVKQFKRQLNLAIKKDKIWTININTTSPRLLNPVSLPNHISDWFFGGKPKKLKEYLQLDNIDEQKLISDKSRIFKNLEFRRNAQNEQVIWSMAWASDSSKGSPKLLFDKPWRNNSRKNSYNYALFLSRNFFISPFRLSGLQSIKYRINIKGWYRSSYSLFILNNFEIYLINNNFLRVLLFYPPILRLILFKIKNFLKKVEPLSMQ
tara:strand:- start:168 stop:1082 length:915 start_codon:yes stop_codon:yes gene_type:complete